MRFEVEITTFNGIHFKIEDEIFIIAGKKEGNFLSNESYKELQQEIKNELKIDKFEFSLISKRIENLLKNGGKIDEKKLIEKIKPHLLNEAKTLLNSEIKNEHLKRAIELYNAKQLKSAKNLLQEVDENCLSPFEKEEFLILNFKLTDEKEEKAQKFEELKEKFANNREKLKELYFAYIKFLEDIRDEKGPFKVFRELEKTFSKTELNDEEKSYFHYLKGRNYYLRGEFLLALKNFARSFKLAKNEEMKGDILNSATNSFTDNLFFDEALQMAKKALAIRKKFNLPIKIAETLSLIGGIYLKKNNPKKALKYFKNSEKLQKKEGEIKSNRIYNYLAKSAILLNDTDNAKKYLKKAKKFDDKKGFTVLTEMFLLYNTKNYKKMAKLAKKTLFLENNYDKVVLAWSYFFLAQKAFEEKKYFAGEEFLENSIKNFLEDNYVLEAYFVSILKFSLPKKEKKRVKNLFNDYNVKSKFMEFAEKHNSIADKYCEVFEIENSQKNNLEKFSLTTKKVPINLKKWEFFLI